MDKLSRSSVTASDVGLRTFFLLIMAAVSSGMNGSHRGCTYVHPRGEILRRWTDGQRRRHSARVLPSIMDVSVGIEDDQIPS